MEERLTGLATALQNSALGLWASGHAYPYANIFHLLGLIMLVGGIGVVDLRLAGAFRALPPAAVSRALTPTALAGLLLMLPTGLILFAADAGALASSATFRWKLALIAVALVNGITFRWLWHGRLDDWDATAPPLARLMAIASLLLWLAAGTQGRMIAYS